jgi:hypothetical protein
VSAYPPMGAILAPAAAHLAIAHTTISSFLSGVERPHLPRLLHRQRRHPARGRDRGQLPVRSGGARGRRIPTLRIHARCARPGNHVTVTVKAPATSHEVRLSKIEAWLQSGGRSPNEQALKVRLRLLGP